MEEGYSNDPHMTKDAIETLAIRGATKVEGGYKLSRDLKVKQVQILINYYNYYIIIINYSLQYYIHQML